MSDKHPKNDRPVLSWLENGLKNGSGVSKHLVNNWVDWIKTGPAQDMGRQLFGQLKQKHPDTIESWVHFLQTEFSRFTDQNVKTPSTAETNPPGHESPEKAGQTESE